MISQDEIAALVGSTRQWVTMMLKRSGKDGIGTYRGRNVEIGRSDRLEDIVGSGKP